MVEYKHFNFEANNARIKQKNMLSITLMLVVFMIVLVFFSTPMFSKTLIKVCLLVKLWG
jgi:cytochrome c oxidase assembly protein Cox11